MIKYLSPILFLLSLVFSKTTLAYPNFVGYGYTSCLTCHYNPFGNGPLTDYGRAVAATSIVSDSFYSKENTLDKRGQNSVFLYTKAFNDYIRPSVDYRGLYLKNSVGEKNGQTEYIHMDANVSVVIRMGPKENRDKFIASATFGYAPKPRSGSPQDADTYRSREHYLGYRINNNWGIYAGLMDKVFGIRLPDHVAFSRVVTSNTMNDQAHGFLLHYTTPNWDVGVQTFLGNMSEEDDVRQKGVAATFEYTWTPQFRPGASFQTSKSEYLKKTAYALHSRLGFGKGNSVMGEIGQTSEDLTLRGTSSTSRYWMVQTHLLAKKGLFYLTTIEYLKPNTDEETKRLRWGPGIQWFPYQSIEWRADLTNTRVHSDSSVSNDDWDLTTQVHLWF